MTGDWTKRLRREMGERLGAVSESEGQPDVERFWCEVLDTDAVSPLWQLPDAAARRISPVGGPMTPTGK